MTLSTAAERDDDDSVAVLHAALDAGVTLLDTADAYAHSERDMGHNERLIRRALDEWSGDASAIRVATKGGLTRPGGRWVPDGRAKHLRAACEASLNALGRERIDLYQLHAPDPRVPLSTSVRALAALQRDGLVERIGLCNVNLLQLEQACELAEIASVQVELGPTRMTPVRGGVVDCCRQNGIGLLAHRPFGGKKKLQRLIVDPVVEEVAGALGVDGAQVILAWLRSLGPHVIPLPGPTRVETAAACGRVGAIELTGDALARLDARFPAADVLRRPIEERRPAAPKGDVVILMGIQGAGKSTAVEPLEADGYTRLNRDLVGGTLAELAQRLDDELTSGTRNVALDNTYAGRAARNEVIETAWRHGVPVRCLWFDTPIEQARINVVNRMLDRFGRLLEPEEIKKETRRSPGTFGPRVLLDYQRELEPPRDDEGFAGIEVVPFVRRADSKRDGRVMILDVDKVFAEGITDAQRARLARARGEGWIVSGFAWRPPGRAAPELPEIDIEVATCTHPGGPPVCWCRPPLPGLVLAALRAARAAPERSLLVGNSAAAERLAASSGVDYRSADDLFGET